MASPVSGFRVSSCASSVLALRSETACRCPASWCLSKLRSVLDDSDRQRVVTSGDSIALDLSDCRVDALEMDRVVSAGLNRVTDLSIRPKCPRSDARGALAAWSGARRGRARGGSERLAAGSRRSALHRADWPGPGMRKVVARIRQPSPGYGFANFLSAFRFDRDTQQLFRGGARQIGFDSSSATKPRQ